MTLVQKLAAQWARITGQSLDVTADTTEAELLDQLEDQPTMTQVVESSEAFTQMQDRLTALEGLVENLPAADANEGGLTTEDLTQAIETAVAPLREGLTGATDSLTALTATVEKDRKALTAAINQVKLSKAKAETNTPTPPPSTETKKEEDEEEDGIEMNMKDFLAGGKILSGLNL